MAGVRRTRSLTLEDEKRTRKSRASLKTRSKSSMRRSRSSIRRSRSSIWEEEKRILVGVIADEDTTIGFLLAGIGESCLVTKNSPSFLIVNEGSYQSDVQNFFVTLYNRPNMGVILIASDIWNYITPTFKTLKIKPLPILLEIPTKSSMTKPLKLLNK